jgi:hypothetical protein
MTHYEQHIVTAFQDLCKKNGGASPAEVTHLMAERGQLATLDTVIDIVEIMRVLRDRGLL